MDPANYNWNLQNYNQALSIHENEVKTLKRRLDRNTNLISVLTTKLAELRTKTEPAGVPEQEFFCK